MSIPALNTQGIASDPFALEASLRAYAAIELRMPESGIDWLDDMITRYRQQARENPSPLRYRAPVGKVGRAGPAPKPEVEKNLAQSLTQDHRQLPSAVSMAPDAGRESRVLARLVSQVQDPVAAGRASHSGPVAMGGGLNWQEGRRQEALNKEEGGISRRESARAMLANFKAAPTESAKRTAALDLINFRRVKKASWTKLGIKPSDGNLVASYVQLGRDSRENRS